MPRLWIFPGSSYFGIVLPLCILLFLLIIFHIARFWLRCVLSMHTNKPILLCHNLRVLFYKFFVVLWSSRSLGRKCFSLTSQTSHMTKAFTPKGFWEKHSARMHPAFEQTYMHVNVVRLLFPYTNLLWCTRDMLVHSQEKLFLGQKYSGRVENENETRNFHLFFGHAIFWLSDIFFCASWLSLLSIFLFFIYVCIV